MGVYVWPPFSITTLPPAGGATSANQVLEIAALDSIDNKTPALGQALEASSVPVVLTTAQIATLTPPAAITGFATEATLAAQSAKLPAALGQGTMAQSMKVVLPSDQSAIPTTLAALTATYQEITNLTTVAQTFTAPAGAKWAKVCADANNSNFIRVKIGGTATTVSGIRLEQSRTEDFQAVGNISVIAEGGTNQIVNVTFGA